MKLSSKIVIISLLYAMFSWTLYAQESEVIDESTFSNINQGKDDVISILYSPNLNMYRFNVYVPPLSQKWKLIVSEFNGRELFSEEGDDWPSTGIVWTPDHDIHLYRGIYYVVSISFVNGNRRTITKSTKLYLPLAIEKNKAPLLFFEGNTIDISEFLYKDSSSKEILDFVVRQANTVYGGYKVLIRGHASYISSDPEEKTLEEKALIELSEKRALAVLEKLSELGIDKDRMYYESFGGEDEVSEDVEQRWKNRRVEIYFIKDTNKSSKEETSVADDDPPPLITPDTGEVRPWPDMPILGKGELPPSHIVKFILYYTPSNDPLYIEYLTRIILYYITESKREAINHDIAIAQMLLETNFLRFTGQVRKEQYNFAGIGAVNDENMGNWFATEVIGVRAHIQHLKGYATTQPLKGDLVDPRYPILDRLGLLGSAPLVSTLAGRWATDPDYSIKILMLLRRMYNYSNSLTENGE